MSQRASDLDVKEDEMGRRGIHMGYWWESRKEKDHYEDQDIDGWIILK
jgi:hypothetical protein